MYVLMLSVYKIRKFYKDNKLTAEMNTKAMLIHVLAFGLFVISSSIDLPFVILAFIKPHKNWVFIALDISIIPVTLTAGIAQVLLCIIFW